MMTRDALGRCICENLLRGVGYDACCDDQASHGNDHRTLRYKKAPAIYAIVNSDAVAAADAFCPSNFCHEVFRDARNIDHLPRTHDFDFPLPHKAKGNSGTTVGFLTLKFHSADKIQSCVAPCLVPGQGTHADVNIGAVL